MPGRVDTACDLTQRIRFYLDNGIDEADGEKYRVDLSSGVLKAFAQSEARNKWRQVHAGDIPGRSERMFSKRFFTSVIRFRDTGKNNFIASIKIPLFHIGNVYNNVKLMTDPETGDILEL